MTFSEAEAYFFKQRLPWHIDESQDKYEAVFPDYTGGSIINLHSSLLRAFGLGSPTPTLRPELESEAFKNARHIVVLLIDALGYRAAEAIRQSERIPLLNQIIETGHYTPLTTVFPSLTNIILRSFSTGLTPAEHGIPGFKMVLPEQNVVANMLRFQTVPGTAQESIRELGAIGIDAQDEFLLPTLFDKLSAADVANKIIFPYRILETTLAQLNHHGAAERQPYVTPADLMVQLRETIRAEKGRAFTYAYWDVVDTMQHMYGAGHETVEAEMASLLGSLEREVIGKLNRAEREGKVFVLISDHGHTNVCEDRQLNLNHYPALLESLILPPAGGRRFGYFRAKDGDVKELEAKLKAILPQDAVLMTTQDFLATGLLGAHPHAHLASRIGDLVVILGPESEMVFSVTGEPRKLAALHGGLSPEEMLIPFIAVDLGNL